MRLLKYENHQSLLILRIDSFLYFFSSLSTLCGFIQVEIYFGLYRRSLIIPGPSNPNWSLSVCLISVIEPEPALSAWYCKSFPFLMIRRIYYLIEMSILCWKVVRSKDIPLRTTMKTSSFALTFCISKMLSQTVNNFVCTILLGIWRIKKMFLIRLDQCQIK